MKLSILAVCKAWHQLGLELLYESVILQNIGQLPAFVRALEIQIDLSPRVRHLDISCFVPNAYRILFESESSKNFRLCPRLLHFGFVPIFLIPMMGLSLPPFGSCLTSLEYTDLEDFSIVLRSLPECSASLQRLALTLPSGYSDLLHPKLDFPKLEDIRLCIGAAVNSSMSLSKWTMPNLCRMWLTAESTDSYIVPALLDAYGQNLAFISVSYIPLGLHNHTGLQDILDRCPILQHLVGDDAVGRISPQPLKHPNVQYVDIWYPWTPEREGIYQHSPPLAILKGGFPSLRGCRYLDSTFRHLWDLPIQFPPHDSEHQHNGKTTDAWLTTISEFIDPASVYGNTFPLDESLDEEEWNPQSCMIDANLENDSNAGDSSDWGDEPSDTESADEAEDPHLDEFYWVDNWNADREEVLEIFSKIVKN